MFKLNLFFVAVSVVAEEDVAGQEGRKLCVGGNCQNGDCLLDQHLAQQINVGVCPGTKPKCSGDAPYNGKHPYGTCIHDTDGWSCQADTCEGPVDLTDGWLASVNLATTPPNGANSIKSCKTLCQENANGNPAQGKFKGVELTQGSKVIKCTCNNCPLACSGILTVKRNIYQCMGYSTKPQKLDGLDVTNIDISSDGYDKIGVCQQNGACRKLFGKVAAKDGDTCEVVEGKCLACLKKQAATHCSDGRTAFKKRHCREPSALYDNGPKCYYDKLECNIAWETDECELNCKQGTNVIHSKTITKKVVITSKPNHHYKSCYSKCSSIFDEKKQACVCKTQNKACHDCIKNNAKFKTDFPKAGDCTTETKDFYPSYPNAAQYSGEICYVANERTKWQTIDGRRTCVATGCTEHCQCQTGQVCTGGKCLDCGGACDTHLSGFACGLCAEASNCAWCAGEGTGEGTCGTDSCSLRERRLAFLK